MKYQNNASLNIFLAFFSHLLIGILLIGNNFKQISPWRVVKFVNQNLKKIFIIDINLNIADLLKAFPSNGQISDKN